MSFAALTFHEALHVADSFQIGIIQLSPSLAQECPSFLTAAVKHISEEMKIRLKKIKKNMYPTPVKMYMLQQLKVMIQMKQDKNTKINI